MSDRPPIDLRSDTVTQPTTEMREAMYRAEVGDDVYGEDPTINRLQELGAALMGKEAALFVASGTMGNNVATLTQCGRGQAMIVGDQAHIYHYEAGGTSALGGASMYVVPTLPNGMLDLAAVEEGISDESDPHEAATALVCIENTNNRCGGTVQTTEEIESLTTLAHAHGLAVHMDGARVFNAAAALNVPVSHLVQNVDSVMFCLSKGLCAPVGSLVAGSQEFIRRATRVRKLLGGGMRQAGVLAAAGIVALEKMTERLPEDHLHCRTLAEGIVGLPFVDLDLSTVVTNILIFTLRNQEGQFLANSIVDDVIEKARQQDVLLSRMGPHGIRAVTHYGITQENIEYAIQVLTSVLQDVSVSH